MSKTFAVLLGIASVWLLAWLIAGYAMHSAGSDQLALAERIAESKSRLEPGGLVRVEGTVGDGPRVVSPWGEQPCLAAVSHVSVVGRDRDIHDREVSYTQLVATRRVGPAVITILAEDKRLELPSERWTPSASRFEGVQELPARLNVSESEIERAKGKLSGNFSGYSISEVTLDPQERVFVVARVAPGDGPLTLEADPDLGRVEVFAGTREQYLAQQRGSGGGLRIAGWIVGAGLGPLPLAILGLVLLVRRRRAP